MARGQFVNVALGLHPQLVAERADELPLWKSFLKEARFVGEVGLDAGPKFYRSFEQQKNVFRSILESCSDAGGKVLSVHSVRCASTVIDMVEQHLPQERGVVVMHWFTGSDAEVRKALALGCFFSVNADMLRSARGNIVIGSLPLDRILTETDGPFGSLDGLCPARPTDVPAVVARLAELKCIAVEEMAAVIIANWRRLIA
jgi:TatD DNase family protein